MADEPGYRFIKVHTDVRPSATSASGQGATVQSVGTESSAEVSPAVKARVAEELDGSGVPAGALDYETVPAHVVSQPQPSRTEERPLKPLTSPEDVESARRRDEFAKRMEELETAERNLQGDVPLSGARIAIIVIAVVCLVAVVAAYAMGAF